MNPQGPIVTTIPESNIANNCNIFNSIGRISDSACRILPWPGTMKIESENLVENLRGNKNFKIMSAKIILKLKSWAQIFCNLESQRFWLDLHWSESHQLESTHSRLFDKHWINPWFSRYFSIEKILTLLLHLVHTYLPVPSLPIFLYGRASDPPSPLHYSSAEILAPKGNPPTTHPIWY